MGRLLKTVLIETREHKEGNSMVIRVKSRDRGAWECHQDRELKRMRLETDQRLNHEAFLD